MARGGRVGRAWRKPLSQAPDCIPENSSRRSVARVVHRKTAIRILDAAMDVGTQNLPPLYEICVLQVVQLY